MSCPVLSPNMLMIVIVAPSTANDDETVTPKDDDPEGLKLLGTTTPLESAAKLLVPLYTLRPELVELWLVSYDVSARRGEFGTHLFAICWDLT